MAKSTATTTDSLPNPVETFVRKIAPGGADLKLSAESVESDQTAQKLPRDRGVIKIDTDAKQRKAVLAALDGRRGIAVVEKVEHRVQLSVDGDSLKFVSVKRG